MEHHFMVEFRNVLNGEHDVRIVRIDRMKAALTPDTPARLTHGLPPARRGITPSSYAFTLPPSSTDLFRSNIEANDAVALAEAKKLLERNGVETDEPSPGLLTFALPPRIRFLLKGYQLGMTCRHSNLRVAMETPQDPGQTLRFFQAGAGRFLTHLMRRSPGRVLSPPRQHASARRSL